MHINRDEFLQQLQEEQQLRKYVRHAIQVIRERKTNAKHKALNEEQQLRQYIRVLINEAKTDVATEVPHRNTGINVLAKLLQNIIPTIEKEYKQLTSDAIQRQSFRAHLLKAAQNALAPIDAVADAVNRGQTEELTEDINIDVEDDDKFIPARPADLEKEKEEKEEAQEEEEDAFGIPGEDVTGRNFAEKAFNAVENQIMDAYQSLDQDDDKELFYDYLLTNLKLYFDKFEDELATALEEPTTDAYEQEVAAAEGGEEEIQAM